MSQHAYPDSSPIQMAWRWPALKTPQYPLQRCNPWQVSAYCPNYQALPKNTKAGRHNSQTCQRLRRTVTIPQPWGSPCAGHGVRCDLTAEVWAYPRHSTHQVVVRAGKMTPPVTQAAPGIKDRLRTHHIKHQLTGDVPGGIQRQPDNQRPCET